MTSDLVKRVYEHENDLIDAFTKRYQVHHLVWYELQENMESASLREKRLKTWKRKWKLNLIENMNPDGQDLYDSVV